MIDDASVTDTPEQAATGRAHFAEQHQPTLTKMRHALRTPLNQIIGYSEMLLEENTEYFQELQKRAKALRDRRSREDEVSSAPRRPSCST